MQRRRVGCAIVRASGAGIFMSHAFVGAVEEAFADQARFMHAVVYQDRRAVACGSFCLPGRLQPTCRRAYPADHRTDKQASAIPVPRKKIVFCGLPVSVGAKHLAIAPFFCTMKTFCAMHSTSVPVPRLSRETLLHPFSKNSRLLIAVSTDFLVQLGYRRFSSLAINTMASRFTTRLIHRRPPKPVPAMCAASRTAKSLAAGLRYERITDTDTILRLYGPPLHRLYEAVALSSAHRLELLPISFFQSLTRHLPGRVGLTLVYAGDQVIAFNWSLFHEDTYHFCSPGWTTA